MHNFMVSDITSTSAAVIVFCAVLLPPGFLLGTVSNVLEFRGRSAPEKLLLSVVLSIATAPILAVTMGRFVSTAASVALFLFLALAAVALIWNRISLRPGTLSQVPRDTKIAFALMGVWMVMAVLSLSDLQWNNRLYTSAVLFDHSVRIPFVESVARTGVPPRNPFFGLGSFHPLRYFYYWYVVCALPVSITGLSGRSCFSAGIVWTGFALAALIPLYLKHFLREDRALRRKSLIGISLLFVTGLDLIPYGLLSAFVWKGSVHADLEWWDPNQVTSWVDSLVWVPHHLAALIACMTGFLLLSALDERTSTTRCFWTAVICSMAFASTAGLSLFVAFVFGIFTVPWISYLLLKKQIRVCLTYFGTGVGSLLLSLPYLSDLLRGSSNVGQRFVIYAIRELPIATAWLQKAGASGVWLEILKVPILILIYLLEFGFFFFIAILRARQEFSDGRRITPNRASAWVLLTSSLLLVSFLASDPVATGGNDLGFRGMLLVQFILLLWGAPVLHDLCTKPGASALSPKPGRGWKVILVATLLLGGAGSAYQLLMLRCYAPLVDAGKIQRGDGYMGVSPGLGERTYLVRDGFRQLDRVIQTNSVVQYNPVGPLNWVTRFYSRAQTAAGDASCGANFGGDILTCNKQVPYLLATFNSPSDVRGWDLDRFCDAFAIDVLVATDTDPAWRDPGGWVWTRRPIAANAAFRGIPCGTKNIDGPRR